MNDYLIALGPTLLVILGGVISWRIKHQAEQLKAIEEKLREERRKVYEEILEPYIQIFADTGTQGLNKATKKITSFNYKKSAISIALFGSDEVIKSWNEMMQHCYQHAEEDDSGKAMLKHFANFMLEVRKSLGNKETELEPYELLRGIIKDIDDHKDDYK
mgnify:CR=1 FL=1